MTTYFHDPSKRHKARSDVTFGSSENMWYLLLLHFAINLRIGKQFSYSLFRMNIGET